MMRQTDQTKSLLEAWGALVRYRWRFILATFGVMSGVLVGSFLLPRQYKAESIFDRNTDMVLTEMMDHGASRTFMDSQRASLIEEIAGQIAIDELIETFKTPEKSHVLKGLNDFEIEALRSAVTRRVSVSFDIGTPQFDRVRVAFLYHDREVARAVVNTLVENYIERTRHTINGRLAQTADFFHSEVARSRELIEVLENKKLTFEIDHSDLLPDFPGSIQVRLTDAQKELGKLQQAEDALAMRVHSLHELTESTPELTPEIVTTRNPRLSELEQKLRELKEREESFTGQYKMTQKHPDLQLLHEQIAHLNMDIQATPKEVVTQKSVSANHKRETLEVQFAQAVTAQQVKRKEIVSLKELIDRYNQHSAQLFPVRSDYRKLSREISQSQRQMAFWEENLRRVQMSLTAESGERGNRLNFIKPCEPISKPVSPNLVQVLMASVVLGLTVGTMNVFFAHRMDDSFRDGEEMTNTFNIPLLGGVSEIISKKQRMERRVRNMILYPLNTSAMAAVLIMVIGLLYLNLEKPHLFEQLKGNPAAFFRQSSGGYGHDAAMGKE